MYLHILLFVMYFVFKGHRLNGADCLKFGLATHFTSASRFSKLTKHLEEENLEEVSCEEILNAFNEEPTQEPTLGENDLKYIEEVFGQAKSIQDLVKKVNNTTGKTAEFCQVHILHLSYKMSNTKSANPKIETRLK